MTKLLDLTIKINDRANYKESPSLFLGTSRPRVLSPSSIEIKDQEGTTITELKKSRSFGNFLVVDIRNINVNFKDLDVPISWAWENKDTDTEIEFTLKNIKYDPIKGFEFGNIGLTTLGTPADTLFLNQDDFEVEVFESQEDKEYFSWSIIELSNRYPNVKTIFNDFRDLFWQITKAQKEEKITDFVPAVENYQNSLPPSLLHQFYNLRNISDNSEEIKNACQTYLEKMRTLNSWKEVGLKTFPDIEIAKRNRFDIIANPSLKSEISGGKYKGFPVTSSEEYKAIISTSTFSTEPKIETINRKRYTRDNIDTFRQFFTNDADQFEPKYFRGFRPGDIKKKSDGKFVSINHKADIRDAKNNEWEITKGENFTRVYYELKTLKKEDCKLFEIFSACFIEKLAEMAKTRKETYEIYWGWIQQFWPPSKYKDLKKYHQNLTELLSILETSYTNESRNSCETASNILKKYDKDPYLYPYATESLIKFLFITEIKDKKTEIDDRMKVIFSEEIDASANEDYGSGPLNSEQKKIFTVHKSEIKSETILTEIKELIELLFKAEKIIAELKNLDQMALANKLAEEYQNGKGNKKTAYVIVNQVDNQWVDRTITALGVIKKKDQQQVLTEQRTRLKTKYGNDVAAQVVFDSNFLDTMAALDEAEKLWTKVKKAEVKSDTDTSLLTFLQGYQNAGAGTIKNKAWQAVNGYNQQAEAVIKHLQKTDQSREELIKTLQTAKNESELEAAYNQAKNNKLYKLGYKSKKIIDSLRQRKKAFFRVEKDDCISVENKTFLQVALVKLVPDTIKDNNDEQALVAIENQLKIFQTASENEEKGKIYKEYKDLIDQVLTEISQEKQRYQQAKNDLGINEMGDTNQEQVGLPGWAWGIIIVGSIMGVGIIILVIIQSFRESSESA